MTVVYNSCVGVSHVVCYCECSVCSVSRAHDACFSTEPDSSKLFECGHLCICIYVYITIPINT